ncbi:hypothetical protein [Brevundimonas sp.]|uniref:hypothetical protein n=1 Tax=Brevundimonas sp. TaxID=1871086 RepID=UPI003D6D2AB7
MRFPIDLLVERAPQERELAEIDGAIETAELKTISAPLKAHRMEIQDRLASYSAPSVIQLHPGAAEAYRRLATDLHQAIEGDDGEEVRVELRKLIDRVDFISAEGLGKFQLEVHGSLAALLAMGGARTAKSPAALGCGAFRVLGCGSRI